jgi:hypothetical protein
MFLSFLLVHKVSAFKDIDVDEAMGFVNYTFTDENSRVNFQIREFPYLVLIPYNEGYRGIVYNSVGTKKGVISRTLNGDIREDYFSFYNTTNGFITLKPLEPHGKNIKIYGMRLSVMDPGSSCKAIYVTTRKSVNLKEINMNTYTKCLWMVSPQLTNFTITSGGDPKLLIHHPVTNFRSELKNVGSEERYEGTSLLLRWEKKDYNVNVVRDEILEDGFVNNLELSCAPYTSNSIEVEVVSNGTINEDTPRYIPTPAPSPRPTVAPTQEPDKGTENDDDDYNDDDDGLPWWAIVLIVIGAIILSIPFIFCLSLSNCRGCDCRGCDLACDLASLCC